MAQEKHQLLLSNYYSFKHCQRRNGPRVLSQFDSQFKLSFQQGPTGRCFQLRDGSGSGIGKNFGFGSGLGSGSGIGTVFFINRVLSGNENIDRVFSGISISRLRFQN